MDRTGMDQRFNQQVGEVLDVPLESPLHTLRVFIDRSSAEYFFNDGEATFTAHACPTAREHSYTMTDGAPLRLWPLEGAVTNAFVL